MKLDSTITSSAEVHSKPSVEIVVIGGGVIGVCVALALQKSGKQVMLLERDAIASGASGGNAGHIACEQVEPVASFAVLKQIPAMLWNPLGPLRIDYRYTPQLLPWFIQLLWHLREKPYQASSQALQQINQQALSAWESLLAAENLSHLLQKNGSYAVTESKQGEQALKQQLQHLNEVGIPAKWITQADLHQQLPLLTESHCAGLFYPTTAHVVSPKALCEALHQRFSEHGGLTRLSSVHSITEENNAVQIKVAGDAETIECQQTVIATGIASVDLVKQTSGIRVPLQDERGYHLMTSLPQNGEHGDLHAPIISMDRRFIMTPMQEGLRLSGMVEYSGKKAAPNWQRAHNFLPLANGMLKKPLVYEDALPWFGRRPTLPDSLPVIDRVGRIAYAFGHQHLGLTQAAVTAQWITQLLHEQAIDANLTPYRLNRFR